MTFCTEEFLKEGEHYDVWFAIVEGRVEDALQLLKTYLPEEKRSWLSIERGVTEDPDPEEDDANDEG